MGGDSRARRPVVVGAIALAAVALALAGAQALDRHGFEVVAAGSVAPVLAGQDQDDPPDDATLVTTERAVRALEAGLLDGDRLPADRPPLLVVRVLQHPPWSSPAGS